MGNKGKRLTKEQKKEIRLRKARQWLTTYSGSPRRITQNYRKRFHLDHLTATRDMQEIGVEFTQEYLDAVKRREEERIRQKHLERERRAEQDLLSQYPDSDDTFAFIAGYTGGGAAYGITWEELGLEPYAPYEDLMAAYDRFGQLSDDESDEDWDDLFEDE